MYKLLFSNRCCSILHEINGLHCPCKCTYMVYLTAGAYDMNEYIRKVWVKADIFLRTSINHSGALFMACQFMYTNVRIVRGARLKEMYHSLKMS